MPKRQKQIQVNLMKDEDIKYWAESIVAPDPDTADEHKDEQLAHRVVNLADMTSLMSYLIRVNSQELYHAMQAQAIDNMVLRNVIINELDVPVEKLEELKEEIREKMESNQRVVEKLQQMQAQGEDISEEDLEKLNKELEEINKQGDV